MSRGGRDRRAGFAVDLAQPRRIDQRDVVQARPRRFAAPHRRAALGVGGKDLPPGQRVQQRRFAAGDRAESDDLQLLRLAFFLEAVQQRFQFAAHVDAHLAVGLQVGDGGQVLLDFLLLLGMRQLAGTLALLFTPRPFPPRVTPQSPDRPDGTAGQDQRPRADGGQVDVGPGLAQLQGAAILGDQLRRNRHQQIAHKRQSGDQQQAVNGSAWGHDAPF